MQWLIMMDTAELVTLHEADTTYSSNPARGVQLYMSCIQIKVTSSGSQSLPGGTSFPGMSCILT